MSAPPSIPPHSPSPSAVPPHPTLPAAPAAAAGAGTRWWITAVGLVAVVGLTSSVVLWQRLSNIQEQLARQSADAGAQSIEARAMSRSAQELARDTAARLSVAEARVSEVSLQRSQLEELIQSLSRSRDENLVVDIESAIRLALQQSELTGSLAPVQAALKSAALRIDRAAQPRLTPVQHAIERDLDRMGRVAVQDTSGLLGRIDDLARQVDELPLLNAVVQASTMRARKAPATKTAAGDATTPAADEPLWQTWLRTGWDAVADEARGLVRVSRIDHPDAALLAPQQAYFLRENLKLTLMNARLGILARRMDAARSDLSSASNALRKYFDPASRHTQRASETLVQLQSNLQGVEPPRLDDTFAALTTAAAGR